MNLLDKFNSGRIPAERMQHRCRVYGIVHFSLNTFTDREWGYGDESPALFHPSSFDARQIVRAAKDGGLGGLILVCKHHDGFCLWPTATTPYHIGRSPWKDGQGDLVREFADACRSEAMHFGVYVSPWDRNHPEYGQAGYREVFHAQLRELLTAYAPIFEVWFDGANGGDGYYGGARENRQIDRTAYYDWEATWRIVRELAPQAAIFSDAGPDLRWVGNEKGFAAPECFGSFTPHPAPGENAFGPGAVDYSESPTGQADGRYYLPPECDVPLRPGWFYHAREDEQLRPLELLVEIYLKSVGNGGFLNLGLAPDRRGLLHENDVARLREFKAAVDAMFCNETGNGIFPAEGGIVELGDSRNFNLVDLEEDLTEGEQIDGYTLEVRRHGIWRPLLTGRAIGAHRIRPVGQIAAEALRLYHGEAKAAVKFRLFQAPERTAAPDECNLCNRPDYHPLMGKQSGVHEIKADFPVAGQLHGFIFSPDPDHPETAPRYYEFQASSDGKNWETVISGEFANLHANPIPQVVEFQTRQFRAIRFRAGGGTVFACAAFGILEL